jgi:hypothetical protein
VGLVDFRCAAQGKAAAAMLLRYQNTGEDHGGDDGEKTQIEKVVDFRADGLGGQQASAGSTAVHPEKLFTVVLVLPDVAVPLAEFDRRAV